jgi:hypothetical protein
VDRRPGRGSPLRRHGRRDDADADPGGVLVLLPFPGTIHVLRFLSAIRFRSNTRFPGIIRARSFLCFIRYTGIIHAAPRIIRRPGAERRFCLGAGPCCEPNFLLYVRRFRQSLKEGLVGFLKAFRDPEPDEVGARPQPAAPTMAAAQPQPNAAAPPGATAPAPAAGPPTSLTPSPASPPAKPRAQ